MRTIAEMCSTCNHYARGVCALWGESKPRTSRCDGWMSRPQDRICRECRHWRPKGCLLSKAVNCELDIQPSQRLVLGWDLAPADIRERGEVILSKKG